MTDAGSRWRSIGEAVTVPVVLAGEAVRPFGVDLCSGVRTEGRLDEAKPADFMARVGVPPARSRD